MCNELVIVIRLCNNGVTCGISWGVVTISRLPKMIGLFCRMSSLLKVSFAKETYDFKEPTNRSHPMINWIYIYSLLHLVSFAKEPYIRDHILQKRPVILRSLLIVATP